MSEDIMYIDENEKNLIEEIHNEKYIQPKDMQKQMQELKEIAQKVSSKKKPVNIRLLESDIIKIKAKALYEGIPYQTLIGSIIHKFANDRLKST